MIVVEAKVILTQEEFDKFAKITLESYSDEWYSNAVLVSIADDYNLQYKDIYD